MKKILFFLTVLLIGLNSYSQNPDPDLIQKWYLHLITIEGEDHSPAVYGFYPDIEFADLGETHGFYLPDPLNVSCTIEDVVFSQDPPYFQLSENRVCFPKQTCLDGPEEPCSQIYGMHADFYYNTLQTLLNYNLVTNGDGTQALEITNENGNVSLYGDEPLLQRSQFSENTFKIYPNPVSNQLFISSKNNTIEKLNVYSINGQLMLSVRKNTNQLDVSTLSNGLYFIEIASGNGSSVQKFIKK
ncbi:T9SS type A sorting domain-containing protein [Marixanthomonas ophiurae]|uniref:T9SS C-terminal target domain-containing protein n=1 Tax=Marixanthomonas ophiurae TaxID=387659 RepID=A0A3E1Q9W1_9FLAO|nr:T9SS type A sorting domain-containing protein [Marixanthomonas ophiurae]RFN58925.1 T9SS C-terminal target domain-containing protein [Marixanthomonas ophiurae]